MEDKPQTELEKKEEDIPRDEEGIREYKPRGFFGFIIGGIMFFVIVIITAVVLFGGTAIISFMNREMANQPARVDREIINLFK